MIGIHDLSKPDTHLDTPTEGSASDHHEVYQVLPTIRSSKLNRRGTLNIALSHIDTIVQKHLAQFLDSTLPDREVEGIVAAAYDLCERCV